MSDITDRPDGGSARRPGGSPRGRAVCAGLPFAAVPALLIGIILFFAVGWIAGLVGFVVVGAVVGAWVRLAGDARVLAHLPGREADPTTEARLCNLVEGLSAALDPKDR